MTQIWDINLTTRTVCVTDITDESRTNAEFRLLNYESVSFFNTSHTLELEINSESYAEVHRQIQLGRPVTLQGVNVSALFFHLVKVELQSNRSVVHSATLTVQNSDRVSVRFSTNIQGVFIGGASFTKPPSGRPAVCEGCRFYEDGAKAPVF